MKTLLLVEDDAMLALVEKKLLEDNGYRIINAYNAKAAINAADEHEIDLVLMDIDLGEGKMDGTEAAETILRKHDLPIVFCTGHSEKEYVDRVKGITSYGYVIKNSGDFVLLQSIEMALQLFDAHKDIKGNNMDIARVNEELRVTIEDLERSNEELRRRDERLELLNKSLRTLSECNQILVRSRDEKSLIEDICRAAVENAGYRLAWVGFVEDTGEKRVVPVAAAGDGRGYVDTLDIMADSGPSSGGATAAAVRTGRPVVIDNISAGADYGPWKDRAAERGFKSFAALPLKKGETVFAVLNIYSSNPATFQAEELALLEELADDLSYGINNLRNNRDREKTRNLLDNIIENLPLGMQVFDEAGYSYRINKKQRELLGLPDSDLGIGRFNVLTDPYSIANGADKIYQRVYQGEYIEDIEKEYNFDIPANKWKTRKEKRFFHEIIFPIFNGNNTVEYVVSLLEDITDRMESQQIVSESEKKYRELFENAPVGIFLTTSDGHAVDVNPTMAAMVGASSAAEAIERFQDLSQQLYVAEERREDFVRALKENGFVENFEYEARRLDGEHRWFSMNARIRRTLSDGRFLIDGFTTDITQQKESMRQKDYLMKEINHRVKNNLMLISSLVSLKGSDSGNKQDLSDIKRQIDAIRIVHENLYNNDDVTHIFIREYVHDLLLMIFSASADRYIHINNTMEDEKIQTRTAVTIGLIVNEIATNSMKHGFSNGDGDNHIFNISLKKNEDEDCYVLSASNNGEPIPEEVDLNNTDTLGLRLLTVLAEQINGSLEMLRTPYPEFILRFPLED